MPITNSPLRYPGGKTQLWPFVVGLMQANDLYKGIYAEPFAGGAGIAWHLLLNGHVSEVWINDLDPAIHAFWFCVLNHCDDLCELIQTTPVTLPVWHEQRDILSKGSQSPLELGFATLFLNRTNRSGILKGGVIGGLKQDGNYKIGCRYNAAELIRKIQRIANYRSVIRLSRLDAIACIRRWDKSLPTRSLINLDPPYFTQGKALYLNYYQARDHERLAKVVSGLKRPWMVTYDDAPEIEALYAGFPQYRNSLIYYAQTKRRANELLFLSNSLYPPAPAQDAA
ncbi:DNA adenine methylase [Mitsuaria sp. BK045]|uniref:DNA adenine methylase n=1 Tax=unclassified Roseateles TaxID=2626991 RepID=UPI00161D66C1|nr:MULTISPECIES: DNA adenine methylase [unclassified Roseateles]MBB3295197.1 DNA adenine methylase [Mitsuaria sp. BK041]MBB3364413.1 DNA adenine methylase [Mitsuaria sp. BK045]